VRGQRGCSGELGDAVGDPEVGTTREDAVAQCGVAGDAGGGEVAFGVLDRLAGELVVPGLELVVAAGPDLDPGRGDRWRSASRVIPRTFSKPSSR